MDVVIVPERQVLFDWTYQVGPDSGILLGPRPSWLWLRQRQGGVSEPGLHSAQAKLLQGLRSYFTASDAKIFPFFKLVFFFFF